MTKAPSTDQFPWAPFQVFQVKLTPTPESYNITKTYKTVGGEVHVYETVTHGRNKGARYSRTRMNQRLREKSAGAIYRAFNTPYYTNRIGGSFSRGRHTPDIFTIAIGVTNLRARHEEVSFTDRAEPSIDYPTLFELLDEKNFRPLSVLFRNRRKIEDEMEKAVNSLVDSGRSLTKQDLIGKLTVVAERWTGRARDYISGGDKPNLKEKTTDYFRPKKLERNPDLYNGGDGMDEALVETGQLLEAIDYNVFVEQSDDMKRYIEIEKRIEKRVNREARLSAKVRKQIQQRRAKRSTRERKAREKALLEETGSIEDMIRMAVSGMELPDIVFDTISEIIDRSAKMQTPGGSMKNVSLFTVRYYRSTFNAMKQIDALGQKTGEVFGTPYAEWRKKAEDDLQVMFKTAAAAKNWLLTHGVEESQI